MILIVQVTLEKKLNPVLVLQFHHVLMRAALGVNGALGALALMTSAMENEFELGNAVARIQRNLLSHRDVVILLILKRELSVHQLAVN